MANNGTLQIFEEMPFDSSELYKLWKWIKAELENGEELWNRKIKNNVNFDDYPWKESTLLSRVLPKMKEKLVENGIIEIEKKPQDGKFRDKGIWRLKDE